MSGPVKVNVERSIVAPSIALLKVALMTVRRLGQEPTLSEIVTVGTTTPQEAEVVKVHGNDVSNVLPKVSAAPVVIVAVNLVFAARLAEGVKVAVLVAEAYVIVPFMLGAPGPLKVKVEALRVAGFIAWLKVALITPLLGQIAAFSFSTVGAVWEAAVGFLLELQHPTERLSSSNAVKQVK